MFSRCQVVPMSDLSRCYVDRLSHRQVVPMSSLSSCQIALLSGCQVVGFPPTSRTAALAPRSSVVIKISHRCWRLAIPRCWFLACHTDASALRFRNVVDDDDVVGIVTLTRCQDVTLSRCHWNLAEISTTARSARERGHTSPPNVRYGLPPCPYDRRTSRGLIDAVNMSLAPITYTSNQIRPWRYRCPSPSP